MSEWMHVLMQQAHQQVQDNKLNVYGHCTVYDPVNHAGKFLIPQYRDEDDNPLESGWCPIGSSMVGDKWGIQYALKGGATQDDPSQGEQCQITILQRSTGLWAVANLSFNDTMTPPGAGLGDTSSEDPDDPDGTNKLKGGELIVKHESGSFLKFYEDGHVQLYVKDNLVARVEKDCEVTVIQGDLTVDVQQGDLTVDVQQGDIDITADESSIEISAPLSDISIESQEGSILVTTDDGDVSIESTAGTVTINGDSDVEIASAANVNIFADVASQIMAPLITAGLAAFEVLCNFTFMENFNGHTHTAPGGVTSPPIEQAVLGVHTTTNFYAS